MAKSKKKKVKLKQKLTNKYRLVVLNEHTFEERFALKLSRLNVYIFGGLFSVILILATIVLIAFTPIRGYIPGYSSVKLKTDARKLTLASDSLQNRLAVLENYTKSIKSILTGEVTSDDIIDSIQELSKRTQVDQSTLNASKQDSIFREKIESRDRFPLSDQLLNKVKIVFFAPISGTISQSFNSENKHFAIDVVAKTGTPVKAVADGTVIFSEWTTETGYVIILKHTNNFISVYKHNGILLKQQGDQVQSGEAIASIGSSGELTTGPHLHFELWSDGYAVNPANYIDFE
ncbi:MAG: M23 family metallopeptidase [Flavobacteriaceae bacterium]|jgi:murein DD-endopeptidase MepM/ murein hydrolase activator NlpD|tara:strand:- start:2322 stop:3191 length:870 start_codon:yes stop_codon:yes gene_type:complete